VLLIPEPVVTFAATGVASTAALAKLRSILPPHDQCVRIEDPLSDILDRVQTGAPPDNETRYFLSRIRAGEADDVASATAVNLIRRSLAAFQARSRSEEQSFEEKIVTLQLALAAEVESFDSDAMRVSAFTGMPARALQAAAAKLEALNGNLPASITEWC